MQLARLAVRVMVVMRGWVVVVVVVVVLLAACRAA
jgi:hypothetical protein